MKYVNDGDQGPNFFMILMACFVMLTGYQIYKAVRPGGSGGKGGKPGSKGKGSGSSSNWFGGGNMMGNM